MALLCRLKVDSPYSGETFTEVAYDTSKEAHAKLDASVLAQQQWQRVPLSERQELCKKWIDALASNTESIARDISGQMGKPLQQARNEVNGTIARAK
jgi:acyl-CoA reductase-like NAD-dependent aldehyde dehydrogenase